MISCQHGDFHFNNLLFKREASGRIRVMIVDWQLAYSGRSTGDLSYLLMSSLSHEVRLFLARCLCHTFLLSPLEALRYLCQFKLSVAL
jgi:aminoglycoside/choline kinase family phosphotransferase